MAASSLRSGADGDADLDNETIKSDRDAQSIDPCTGFIIEAVSTITTPSLDSQMGFNEMTPRISIGDPNEAMKKDKRVPDLKVLKYKYRRGDTRSNTTGKDIDESVYYDPDEKVGSDSDGDSDDNKRRRRVGSHDENGEGVEDPSDAIENTHHDNEDIDDHEDADDNESAPVKASAPVQAQRAAMIIMPSSPTTKKSFKMDTKSGDEGEEETNEELSEDALRQQKYRETPADVVVVALAMISTHVDLSSDSKEMAMKWLGVWDDASANYRALRTKGNNISGM